MTIEQQRENAKENLRRAVFIEIANAPLRFSIRELAEDFTPAEEAWVRAFREQAK